MAIVQAQNVIRPLIKMRGHCESKTSDGHL